MLAILTPLLFTGTVKSQALTNQIEEIIVTAQKTEQNLQDVPIAVSAFDSDAIALKQLDNFMDVQLAIILTLSNLSWERLKGQVRFHLVIITTK